MSVMSIAAIARSARLIAAPLSALLLLGGCSGGFLGMGGDNVSTQTATGIAARQLVVGDEPYAVQAGAAILAQGGSAADAATAMFFALSVTYPAAAGLGGGGICLARDPASGAVREFDFLPRAAARGGAYAVPGAVRGFYALQKRFGILPWQRTVAPAEALANAGFPVSQALSARLAGTESIIRLDASLAAMFFDESGQLKKAGTIVTNPALGQTLAAVRIDGADGFAGGTIAARLLAYSAQQGGALTAEELAAIPAIEKVAAARIAGQVSISYPAPGTGAGAFSAALISRAAATPSQAGTAAVSAVREALTSFGVSNVPADLGSTGFAAVDSLGGAVTCAVTLNGPFGAGRTAADTGIQFAAAPSSAGGLASAFLLPVIANDSNGLVLAGAGAGGPNGGAALVYAVLRAANGAQVGRAADLRSTGAVPYDQINLIVCQGSCVALPDPGGSGLGSAANAAQ